jgi:acyl-coenzyme A thioesterase PaaI-like protein
MDPGQGVGSTTLEAKISFIRPITPETGPITAEGVVINRGRRVGIAEGHVTDGEGCQTASNRDPVSAPKRDPLGAGVCSRPAA